MFTSKNKPETIIDTKQIYTFIPIFLLLCFGLIGRLWYLQIFKGKELQVASEKNQYREISRKAPRGLIFDRDGALLLANRPFFDLVIIPQYLPKKDVEKTINIVAEMFHLPKEYIEKKLQEAAGVAKFVPVRIKRNIALQEVAMVESNKFFLPGIDVDTVPRRAYSNNEAAHLFGYLGEVGNKELSTLNNNKKQQNQYKIGSIIGKQGIEKKYDTYLRGTDGTDYMQVDAQGRLQPSSDPAQGVIRRIQSKRGSDIYLTLDADLQRAAAEAFRNKNGAIIAVNPQNGEVLAYVSHPNFSLSLYQDGLSGEDWQSLQSNPFKPLFDKVTSGAFPPASPYKAITAIAALEENIVTPERTFFCNGSFSLGNARWGCCKKQGHGVVNVKRALEYSCDVYFYQVGAMLGAERMAKWARLFGLGEKTGLDLNSENRGLVPNSEWKLKAKHVPWQSGDTINMSIGQGFNLITPVQMAMLYAALGNGGRLYRPFLLKRVLDAQGKQIAEEQPLLRRQINIRPENLRVVKNGLYDVVNSATGTGKLARVPGYSVAGKSGTAQNAALKKTKGKNVDEVAIQQRDHAWFVAYSPSDVPEITVAVFSEYEGGGGGLNAAPIAAKVIEAYWRKKFPENFIKHDDDLAMEKNVIRTEQAERETLPGQIAEVPENNDSELEDDDSGALGMLE